MNRTKKIVLIAVGVVIAVIAGFLVPTLWVKPLVVDHIYICIFAQYVLRRPMYLSFLRILEPMGIYFHNAKRDDFSDEFEKKEARWLERQARILRSCNRKQMGEAARLFTTSWSGGSWTCWTDTTTCTITTRSHNSAVSTAACLTS
jgi:hypothetical protein